MGNSSSYGVDLATIRPKEAPAEENANESNDDLPFSFPQQHLSRSIQVEKPVNNSLVDVSVESACSDVVEQAQNDFVMERRFLRLNKNMPIGRCSSPTRIKCFHCAHGHGKRCCLYLGDHLGDMGHYSKWKKHLEQGIVRPGHFPHVPEAVSGGTTPNWFPKGTFKKRRDIHRRKGELNPPLPTVYFRRFAFPLLTRNKYYKMLEKRIKQLTPYEEYKREMARQRKVNKIYKPVMVVIQPNVEEAIEAIESDEDNHALDETIRDSD